MGARAKAVRPTQARCVLVQSGLPQQPGSTQGLAIIEYRDEGTATASGETQVCPQRDFGSAHHERQQAVVVIPVGQITRQLIDQKACPDGVGQPPGLKNVGLDGQRGKRPSMRDAELLCPLVHGVYHRAAVVPTPGEPPRHNTCRPHPRPCRQASCVSMVRMGSSLQSSNGVRPERSLKVNGRKTPSGRRLAMRRNIKSRSTVGVRVQALDPAADT